MAEKQQWRWIRQLWTACWVQPGLMVTLLIAVIGSAGVDAAVPLAAKQALDSTRTGDTRTTGVAAGLLVALGIARFFATCGRRWLAGRLAFDVQHSMRIQLLSALHRYDGPGQDKLRTGQVASRSITDLQLTQGLFALAPESARQLVLFVVAAAVMLVLSPLLAIAALLMVPAIGLVVYRTWLRLHAATWSAQQRSADLAQHVEETVTGVRVVKGFGQEARMLRTLELYSKHLYAERVRAARINSWIAPSLAAVPQLGLVIVIALGGTLALRGTITVGTFLVFASYVTVMAGSARIMSTLVVTAQLTRAAVERVYQVIDDGSSQPDPPVGAPVPAGPLGVDLQSVTFGFDPDRPVLHGFDLTVQPGETVAIIGPTGSGKSTIAQLILRFYRPDSGRILLYNAGDEHTSQVDIDDLRAVDLRAAVGIVFDEPFLFSDTVAANIALGRPDSTDAEIRCAAKQAAADEFISNLPDGYNTVIGERGLTLSGGQRQRLALARALLADPPILILDDTTSAVDAVTEAAIFAALPAQSSRTTIILAHRESTLTYADRVVRLSAPQSTPIADLWGFPEDTACDPADLRLASDVDVPPEIRNALAALPPATERPGLHDRELFDSDPNFGMWRWLRPVRWVLTAVVALVAIDALIGVTFPALTRYALDSGVAAGNGAVFAIVGAGGAALVLVSWLDGRLGTLLSARGGERLLYGLRVRSYAHLQRLGLDYYERELSGRIMTRMTTDIDALSTFLQTGLSAVLVSAVTALGVALTLLMIDAGLAVLILVTLSPMLAATLCFRKVSASAYSTCREQVATVNADFQENVAGLRTSQAYRHEAAAIVRFTRYSNAYRRSRMRAQCAVALYFGVVVACADLALAAVVFVGARNVAHGTTTTGTLVAFVLYMSLLFTPVLQLSQLFDSYQQARVGLRRVAGLLHTPSSIAADLPGKAVAPVSLRGEVVFDAVDFRYPESNFYTLKNISLRIPTGTSLALVGETGAGKSTIVKLLARLYDLPRGGDTCKRDANELRGNGHREKGTIRISGVDIRDYQLSSFRARLGVVPQEAHLFTGDIAGNIAFGRPTATRREIQQAAEAVGAIELIAAQPLGMHSPVGEGGRGLSTGERQLIALARAELVDPDVVLFDEATAVLDVASEEKVLAANRSVARGRTTIIVTHRLTTAARADRIAVVQHGRIVQLGTHDELLAEGGTYARLWQAARLTERDHYQLSD